MSDIVERLKDIVAEEACDRAASAQEGGNFGSPNNIEQSALDAISEIERLRARLAKAERDAARYRWLRDNPGEIVGPSYVIRKGREIDAAIDAALERTP